MSKADIVEAQRLLGVKQDGDWGPRSTAAVRSMCEKLASLGVVAEPIPRSFQFKLGPVSMTRLEGVHPDLRRVVLRAASDTTIPFIVLEGLRSLEQQKKYVDSGASQTMNSRHLLHNGYGHAVDIAPYVDGVVSWHWPLYRQLEPIIKRAAGLEGVALEWGGDWTTLKDGPHWQLPWSSYP